MNNSWNLQLLTRWEEISSPSFTERWLAIVEGSPDAHVFFHPVLVNVWLETYRPLRDLQPLFVHASCGEQEVIFPLVLWKRNWKNAFLRVVVPAGHSDFDYHDPIFLHSPTADQIWSFYQVLKKALDNNVSYDHIFIGGLHQAYVPDFAQVVHQEGCLSWQLDEAELEEGLILPKKKKLAKEVIRRSLRLHELGNLSFTRFSYQNIEAANASLVKMLIEHAKRWPNAYKAPNLYCHLLNCGIQAGLVDFTEVSLDEIPIAWRISFVFKGRYSIYMPAINSEFSKYSVGHLSLGFALASAKKDGIQVADHLRGAEEYKNAWGGAITLIYDAACEGKGLSSKLKLFLFRAVERLRKKVRQLMRKNSRVHTE